MKKLFASFVSLTMCIPAAVWADSQQAAFDPSPQLALYLKIPFGARVDKKESLGPRLGLSLNREFFLTNTEYQFNGLSQNASLRNARSLPVMSFEFGTASSALRINGMSMSPNGDKSAWQNPWLWAGIAAGALVISCATDNFPCGGGGGSGGGSGGGY